MCGRSMSQGESESQSQELDLSCVEILTAIRGILELEVPQVQFLVAPGFSKKKSSKQMVRKRNLALSPIQDIKNMWDHRFRKASTTNVNNKSSTESLSQG